MKKSKSYRGVAFFIHGNSIIAKQTIENAKLLRAIQDNTEIYKTDKPLFNFKKFKVFCMGTFAIRSDGYNVIYLPGSFHRNHRKITFKKLCKKDADSFINQSIAFYKKIIKKYEEIS